MSNNSSKTKDIFDICYFIYFIKRAGRITTRYYKYRFKGRKKNKKQTKTINEKTQQLK